MAHQGLPPSPFMHLSPSPWSPPTTPFWQKRESNTATAAPKNERKRGLSRCHQLKLCLEKVDGGKSDVSAACRYFCPSLTRTHRPCLPGTPVHLFHSHLLGRGGSTYRNMGIGFLSVIVQRGGGGRSPLEATFGAENVGKIACTREKRT